MRRSNARSSVGRQHLRVAVRTKTGAGGLCLVAETLLMATLLHALAALVLGNFRFASFFERAHSDFRIREPGFNHLIRRVATQFFAASRSIPA